MSYYFENNDTVYYYDADYNKIRLLRIRHKMSGWCADEWEYYNCVPVEENDLQERGVIEASQNELYKNKNDAIQQAVSYLKYQAEKHLSESNEYERLIEGWNTRKEEIE
jgi:hypothetical protein